MNKVLYSLKSTALKINQIKGLNNVEYMEQLRSRDSIDIVGHKSKIELLEDKLKRLKKLEKDQIPFLNIMEEIKLHYPEIASVSYSKRLRSDFTDYIDTLFHTHNDSLWIRSNIQYYNHNIASSI